MKTQTSTIALAFLLLGPQVLGAPAKLKPTTTSVEVRSDSIQDLIAHLNEYNAKRAVDSEGSPVIKTVLNRRDYAIVTEFLAALNDADIAPELIEGLVDNEDIQPYITKTIIALIKSDAISLDTLFTALNQSGLAETVIRDLIEDCDLYAEIYKLALSYISNLASEIFGSGSSSDDSSSSAAATTTTATASSSSTSESLLQKIEDAIKRDDDDEVYRRAYDTASSTPTSWDDVSSSNSVVDQLLNSLAKSGLASSVVEALITDEDFLSYGADLIVEIYKEGLLSVSDIVSALKESNLVTDLFKEFFTLDTLKEVIETALKAASGDCDATTLSTLTATTTAKASTVTTTAIPTATSTNTSVVCKKRRKRSYN